MFKALPGASPPVRAAISVTGKKRGARKRRKAQPQAPNAKFPEPARGCRLLSLHSGIIVYWLNFMAAENAKAVNRIARDGSRAILPGLTLKAALPQCISHTVAELLVLYARNNFRPAQPPQGGHTFAARLQLRKQRVFQGSYRQRQPLAPIESHICGSAYKAIKSA